MPRCAASSRGLILRRDPVGSLIDTDRQVEFLAYKSFHGCRAGPRAAGAGDEGGLLERPFFIMSRVDGGKVVVGDDASILMANTRPRSASELFAILGPHRPRAIRPRLPIRQCFAPPDPADCWREALDAWQAVIERDERHPQPIVRAAMRRLRRNPPKPAAEDFRRARRLSLRQFPARRTRAHPRRARLGDGASRRSAGGSRLVLRSAVESFRRRAALPERSRRRRRSQSGNGRAVFTSIAATLAWWKLFSAVKGCAIWTTSAKEFVAGGHDLVLGFAGTYTARRHDRIMADLLERLVEEGWS